MKVNPRGIKIDLYRTSNNVNSNYNGVRITHIPSSIVVDCANYNSNHLNKRECIRKIECLLNERLENTNDNI